MSFAVAILTGGASRRMGRDKATLEVDGTSLVRRIIDVARDAGATDVVTVGGPDRNVGVPHVPDSRTGAGPLGGIATALVALAPSVVVVLACDLPAIDVTAIHAVVGALRTHDAAVARTDRLEPLCSAWQPNRCAGVVEQVLDRGERAVHIALAQLDVVEVTVPAAPLFNVNTPEDLVRFAGREDTGLTEG